LAALLLATNFVGAPVAKADEMPAARALQPLRVQPDAARNRRWVLNGDAVYVYDTARRRLIQRVDLPDWFYVNEAYSCPPDLAIAPSGAALVTSNIVPTIWQIDPQTLSARQHRLVLDADNDKDVGFTGLAYARGGKDLYGVSSVTGTTWKIDLLADRAQKVFLPIPELDTCGPFRLEEGAAAP
jgi:hypothetical protein